MTVYILKCKTCGKVLRTTHQHHTNPADFICPECERVTAKSYTCARCGQVLAVGADCWCEPDYPDGMY